VVLKLSQPFRLFDSTNIVIHLIKHKNTLYMQGVKCLIRYMLTNIMVRLDF